MKIPIFIFILPIQRKSALLIDHNNYLMEKRMEKSVKPTKAKSCEKKNRRSSETNAHYEIAELT
jgi:hypothetical protein